MQLLIKSLGRFFFQHITALLKIDGAGGLEDWRVGGLEGWRAGGAGGVGGVGGGAGRAGGHEGLEGLEGWRAGGRVG